MDIRQGVQGMPDDQVFIVRCWDDSRDQEGDRPAWRVRVEHTNTGVERYFADLPALCAFIEETLQRASRRSGVDLH